jgi:hypothetical protein
MIYFLITIEMLKIRAIWTAITQEDFETEI